MSGSIRKGHVGIAAAAVLLAAAIAGCTPQDQATGAAKTEAHEQLVQLRDSLVELADHTSLDSFADDVARGGTLYGVVIDPGDDESLSQFSPSGSLVYLFGGEVVGDHGVVHGIVTGRGEGGGGGTYQAVQIAVCFDAAITPGSSDAPSFSDTDCPPRIAELIAGSTSVPISSLT